MRRSVSALLALFIVLLTSGFLLVSCTSKKKEVAWIDLPSGWSWSDQSPEAPTAIGPSIDGYRANLIIRESVWTGSIDLYIERSQEFLTNVISTLVIDAPVEFTLDSGLEARKVSALNVDPQGTDSSTLRQKFYYIKVPESHVYTVVFTISNARPTDDDKDIDKRMRAFKDQPGAHQQVE